MKLHHHEIGWYLDRHRSGAHFSLAGYSDAEWFCMAGTREGCTTGLGQVMTAAHGERLWDVLRRRQTDPRFLVAVPELLFQITGFDSGEADWMLGARGIKIEACERDMVTDDLAAAGGLFPLVQMLKEREDGVLIGNRALEPLRRTLRLRHFVGLESPNLHMREGGIEDAAERARSYGRPGFYLVGAGVSAAIIIDQLHDAIPEASFFDCGSMWDAFVGIGGQREWRAKLYADRRAWRAWRRKCMVGH